MSDVTERSPITAEILNWSEAEGKHAQMHLVRRATLMAIEQTVEHIGIDEVASTERQRSVYSPAIHLSDLPSVLRRPHKKTRRGSGERFIATKMVALGEIDDPQNADQPYQFARIEESGDFNIEIRSNRFGLGRQPESLRDTYYRPDFEIKYFASTKPDTAEFAEEIPSSSVRMLDDLNVDVRFHAQWSPESMVEHYDRQIGQLAVFMDELTKVAQAAGAYIHHGTELSYFLDPEEVASHKGI